MVSDDPATLEDAESAPLLPRPSRGPATRCSSVTDRSSLTLTVSTRRRRRTQTQTVETIETVETVASRAPVWEG